ncbi:MAG: desulfoferrodoxin [Lentisphaerae bacterium]|jgi:superoxide reductase|nr:desulfoferrodoxin [Lentisphaerota bacterium]
MEVKRQQVYLCSLCSSVVEILMPGVVPSCCGRPMELQAENTVDASREKHVPVVEAKGTGTLVKVGADAHPMTEKHYIVWIEIINGDYVNRYYLKPGDAPQAEFYVGLKPGMIVREYCNLHGLWIKVIE